MTVVVYELNEKSEFEELGSHTDQEAVENDELLSIFPEQVWQDHSDEWLSERLDGPYVMAAIQDEEPETTEKVSMWTEYVGPNGGEGYQHMLTDEVRYVDEEPTDDEAPGNDVDVDAPDGDELENMTGISDASYIEDNLPVTATWESHEGESFVGQIEEVDYGGIGETFVIAATDGRRYEVDGDDVTGYIEPSPEYNPESNEEDSRIRDEFERTREQLGEGVIPERPVPNMGNGGPRPERDEFRHIGTGRITEEHVEELQRIVDTGDTGNIQVGIEAVGDDVDYGPWDANTDNLSWFDGGQFANIDVEMPIEDFLATQTDMLSSDRNHPQEAYESFHRVRTDDVEEYAEVLQNEPGEMPMPYIEFGRNGNMRNSQEGRHRALAARKAGFDTLPVRFAINAERDGKGADDRVDWGQDMRKAVEKRTKWRPYLGPRGGEGWIKPFSFTDDKIVYDEDPPGEVAPEYSENYWHNRPSPVNEDIVNLVESHLEGVRARPYKLDEPTANFFEQGLEAGYHPNAVSEAAEWKLKSMEKEIGDGGRLEEDDVQKVLRDAATQFLDQQTEQEIEIEGGKRGGGTISLGEIDNDLKRDWWENFESEIGYTDDQMTNEKPAYSAIRNWSMTSSMFSQSTAPLIKAAIQESDNDFIPVNGNEVRETEVTDREIEHVLEYKEALTDLYRSVYGDTVPCFRGIDGQSSQIDGMREDIQEGKGIELPEATLSSWATEPGTAMRFAGNIHTDGYSKGGVVIRQEVPVEQLFVTGDTHPGLLNNENELVVNAPEPETRYEPDNLILPSETTALEQVVWAAERANRDTDVSEEATKAVQRALAFKQEPTQYTSIAIENYDWFRQVAGEQTQPDTKAKEWIPYEGPRGGEGWQNTEDRQDIRYGLEDPPGEVEEGYEDMAEDWGPGEDAVEIPEKFEGEYAPEDITAIPGDPSEWGEDFPFSEGQTILGENWEWTVENMWWHDDGVGSPEPRMELSIPSGVSHTFGYVTDSVRLDSKDAEPGWYTNPDIPIPASQKELVGVVGEPEPQNVGFNPTGEAANAAFDLDEAAERMSQAVQDSDWEPTEAENYATDLLAEHDPSYETMVALARHGLESNGERVNDDRDINDAEEIVLAGVKQHLHNSAPEHPTLKGKLSLGSANDELREDFQSRMTPDTRETVNTAMGEWIKGHGSMVDEYTLPIYRLAAQTYENDFYPTRGDVGELIAEADDVEAADSLEVRQERMERYRQKTIETFREVFGDTVPVFRGYDPGEQSKGAEAREALQSEDGPQEIEIRNGVANSWSTDPTVAHKFSTWTAGDTPGIVVRQQLPVEQIFGSSDTAANVRSDEAEIIAGNPEEYTNHSRDDVFLPEEFDPVEQMRWALAGVENDGEEEEKADGDTLSLDWELESVDWMNRYRDLEEALNEKNWTPIDVGDQSGYQHVVSGETVVSKAGIPHSNTARQAGHMALSPVVTDADWTVRKEWVPYQGPRGGEGWRNTTTENIRYGLDEKPEAAENNPDNLTEENVEEADIQQSFGLLSTTANDLVDGEKLHFEIQGHPYETRVQEVTDDAIHAIDTETRREFEIPIDDRGEPTNGLTLRSPQAVFFGHGIAGSESSWLPEEGEPNQTELEAEALRSAASTDGFGDTSYIEGFAARASEQGADPENTTEAIRGALETHPGLQPDMADEIYENGQRLLEIEESLTDKSLAYSYPITPIKTLRKEWIPYRGPQEGEGWQNVNDPDDIRYGLDDPPGEVAEGYEEQAEDWGPSSDEDPDRVQGATLVDYNIPGSDKDIQVPKNFTADDLKNTIRRFRDDNEGDLLTELANVVQMQQDGNLNDKMDVLHGTAEVLGNHPEIIDQYNDLLHEEIADTPNANFDVPFGFDGVDVHNMLEDAFGPHSEIVGELEDMVLFDRDVDEEKADNWIVAAEGWIRNYGDREMADKFKDAIDDAELANPFSNTDEYAAQKEISDNLNPAKASRVVPLSDTEADTGISANSMFIAEYDDGHRAFVTNTSHHRSERIDEVRTQGEEDAERAMAGYEAFKAAGMDVPRHERLKTEYWSVEEAEGQPAREWEGEPDESMREQFAKLGAVAMLSGNWDMHGGNVFVTENGDLIPVDLDLSGHDMQARDWKHTSWGRLKSLGRTLNMYEVRGDDNEVLELKQDVARATQELVEDGTADDIKSMASDVDNKDIQMAIEENVFAAKGGRLYDDRVRGDE